MPHCRAHYRAQLIGRRFFSWHGVGRSASLRTLRGGCPAKSGRSKQAEYHDHEDADGKCSLKPGVLIHKCSPQNVLGYYLCRSSVPGNIMDWVGISPPLMLKKQKTRCCYHLLLVVNGPASRFRFPSETALCQRAKQKTALAFFATQGGFSLDKTIQV